MIIDSETGSYPGKRAMIHFGSNTMAIMKILSLYNGGERREEWW
jgi:hypothetical protein